MGKRIRVLAKATKPTPIEMFFGPHAIFDMTVQVLEVLPIQRKLWICVSQSTTAANIRLLYQHSKVRSQQLTGVHKRIAMVFSDSNTLTDSGW